MIITVPLPLVSPIAFPPSARERVAATADIGFGNVVKILLRFSTKWWADHCGLDLADLSFPGFRRNSSRPGGRSIRLPIRC